MQYPIKVEIEGGSEQEIEAATEAAMAVFGNAGVTPLEAASAHFVMEMWDSLVVTHGLEYVDKLETSFKEEAFDAWNEADWAIVESVQKGRGLTVEPGKPYPKCNMSLIEKTEEEMANERV
jgi:hypothetical protein